MYNQTISLPLEQLVSNHSSWYRLCQANKQAKTLPALVLTAWQMGLWFAKAIVEQQLEERAQLPAEWRCCSVCGTQLVSKGFAKRQRLTLVGKVEWKRRIGRCPRHCPASHNALFDIYPFSNESDLIYPLEMPMNTTLYALKV